jgi:hypothetical protein
MVVLQARASHPGKLQKVNSGGGSRILLEESNCRATETGVFAQQKRGRDSWASRLFRSSSASGWAEWMTTAERFWRMRFEQGSDYPDHFENCRGRRVSDGERA